jgi:hypothetical protein
MAEARNLLDKPGSLYDALPERAVTAITLCGDGKRRAAGWRLSHRVEAERRPEGVPLAARPAS